MSQEIAVRGFGELTSGEIGVPPEQNWAQTKSQESFRRRQASVHHAQGSQMSAESYGHTCSSIYSTEKKTYRVTFF